MREYRSLFKYFRPYLVQILGASVCITVVTGMTLLIAPLAGFAFKAIGEKDLSLLNLSAAGIIILYLVKGIFTYGQDYLSYYVSNRIIIDLRVRLYEHLQSLSLDFYGRWHTGELISRVMNDVSTLQLTILSGFSSILPQSVLLVGLLVYIFWLNWQLSLLTLIALPLIVQVIRLFAAEIRHISEKMQQKTADITSHLQETVSQVRVVKSFTMEKEESNKFSSENRKSFDISMRVVQILSTQNPVVALLQATAAVSIVWYGGIEIINGTLTLPQLISFATALGIMTDPGSALSKSFSIIQQGMASLKRIFELLEIKPSVQEDKNALDLPAITGKVEFKQVSFAYENNLVLNNINLKAAPGEVIALVGKTGAGKSTLVDLISRFYDPQTGTLLIDDCDLKTLKLKSLRRQIAIVPQDIVLFRGTIRDNLIYGNPEASEAQIRTAVEKANLTPFINSLPNGYQTEVGERGTKVSGGEKQRIAIARAILRDPKILILDEATSSLDAETERLIRDSLEKLMLGRTTFIIAHRLATIEKANRIIVLDGGKIMETGTHQELLAKGGIYNRLYAIQFQNKT